MRKFSIYTSAYPCTEVLLLLIVWIAYVCTAAVISYSWLVLFLVVRKALRLLRAFLELLFEILYCLWHLSRRAKAAFTRALGPSKSSPLLTDFWVCARAPPTLQGFATAKRALTNILSATGFSGSEISSIMIMLNGKIFLLALRSFKLLHIMLPVSCYHVIMHCSACWTFSISLVVFLMYCCIVISTSLRCSGKKRLNPQQTLLSAAASTLCRTGGADYGNEVPRFQLHKLSAVTREIVARKLLYFQHRCIAAAIAMLRSFHFTIWFHLYPYSWIDWWPLFNCSSYEPSACFVTAGCDLACKSNVKRELVKSAKRARVASAGVRIVRGVFSIIRLWSCVFWRYQRRRC